MISRSRESLKINLIVENINRNKTFRQVLYSYLKPYI